LGKIGNCQVAVTAELWTGVHAWLVGAQLYLPATSLTPGQRSRGRIPSTVGFQEKWRQALTLLRQVRASGITVTAVVADAEFGDCAALRRALHRLRLPYALGVSADTVVFPGVPTPRPPTPRVGKGRPRKRGVLPADTPRVAAEDWATQQAAYAWRLVRWRNGTNPPWQAQFLRPWVTPAHDWRAHRRVAPPVWLLIERDLGATPRLKCYLVHLPATASWQAMVHLAHQPWGIEQQYQELKDEVGLDHFEGRSFHGWHRHVALTAVAYAFLQRERVRRRRHPLTFPQARAVVTGILTAYYFLTHRRQLNMLIKLAEIPLRIEQSRPYTEAPRHADTAALTPSEASTRRLISVTVPSPFTRHRSPSWS
jgi:SRSO17 transposase